MTARKHNRTNYARSCRRQSSSRNPLSQTFAVADGHLSIGSIRAVGDAFAVGISLRAGLIAPVELLADCDALHLVGAVHEAAS
jgi:hypothetical protein